MPPLTNRPRAYPIRQVVQPLGSIALDNVEESGRTHIVHYVIRDHFSGVVYSEIALSTSLIPITAFLFRAWSQKEKFPFCGIPDLLMVPKTIERVFPKIKEVVSLLDVRFPRVNSGFMSGVRDIRTIEEFMKLIMDHYLSDDLETLNKLYLHPSTMSARTGKGTKIQMWVQNVTNIRIPPEEWISNDA